MFVGIDAREIHNENTGIGTYVFNLIKFLAKNDRQNEYLLFIDNKTRISFELPDNFKCKRISSFLHKKIQDQIILAIAIWRSKVDIFHVTHHDSTPFLIKIPIVITIHDIFWIDSKGNSSYFFRKYYSIITNLAIKKAVRIITVSESTMERVLEYYPFANDKIKTVYIACNEDYLLAPTDDGVFNILKSEFGLRRPYVLYVGSFAKRKNFELLFNAMKILWSKNQKIQLVIAGNSSRRADTKVSELIRNYSSAKLISRPKSIEELKSLYKNAEVFVFPSLYEGFGIPVLEAMSCGCPVIVSNLTSLPEIVGPMGILVDANDETMLADKILNMLVDSKLREKMKTFGIEQAKKFSWEKVALETKKNYFIAVN